MQNGIILSPYLFHIYAENILRNVRNSDNYDSFYALKVGGLEIPELRYADDTVLLSQSTNSLNNLIKSVEIYS
jgi:hypothetical protein